MALIFRAIKSCLTGGEFPRDSVEEPGDPPKRTADEQKDQQRSGYLLKRLLKPPSKNRRKSAIKILVLTNHVVRQSSTNDPSSHVRKKYSSLSSVMSHKLGSVSGPRLSAFHHGSLEMPARSKSQVRHGTIRRERCNESQEVSKGKQGPEKEPIHKVQRNPSTQYLVYSALVPHNLAVAVSPDQWPLKMLTQQDRQSGQLADRW